MRTGRPPKPGIKHADAAVERTLLEQWREEQGWSYSQLAKNVGATPWNVILWCRGTALPTLPSAFRVEKVTSGAVPVSSWLGTAIGRHHYERLERIAGEKMGVMARG